MVSLRIIVFFFLALATSIVYLLILAVQSPSHPFIVRILKLSGDNIFVPAAIILSILAAGATAAFSIAQARAAEKRKNTLDFLNMKFTKPELIDGIRAIRNLQKQNENTKSPVSLESIVVHAFNNTHNYSDVDFEAIRVTLNYYEHLALGIKKNIYDQNLVLQDTGYTILGLFYRCGTYLRLRNTISKITMLRHHPYSKQKDSSSFSALIWLAERWLNCPWYYRWFPGLAPSAQKKLSKLEKYKAELEKSSSTSAKTRRRRSLPK